MADDSYTANRLRALRAPLAGPNGRAWATALGSAQDDEAPVLRVAGVCRSLIRAPEDALSPVLGSAFQRTQAPRELYTEPLTGAFRARLGHAWSFWESAPLAGDGLDTGITSIFEVYADPSTPVIGPAAYVVNAAGAGFAWSSEFVIVWPSPLLPDDAWDDPDFDVGAPTYDDGGIWDVEFTPSNPHQYGSFGVADLDWIKRQVRLCKSAQGYPTWIAVGLAFDGFNPPVQGASALWDDGSVWDQNTGVGEYWDNPDTLGMYTVWPLGHVWEEEETLYGGSAVPWDADPDATWDADGDAFEPPTGGW